MVRHCIFCLLIVGCFAPASAESPDDGDATPPVGEQAAVDLRAKIGDCLAHYRAEREKVAVLSPWGVMHAVMAYGQETEVLVRDEPVNGIQYLLGNGSCRGLRLLEPRGQALHARIGPGLQGHAGQLLAVLAQCDVPKTQPLEVDGIGYSIDDLIRHEQHTCQSGSELTFKLIGLVHYLDSDATWTCGNGEEWSIPRLIREEMAQPVVGVTCGGTHRMMGFSYAVRKREERDEPFEGQWLRARQYVASYHEYAFKLQNEDGSFSTAYFARPESRGGRGRKLLTTGHILEWLVFSLPESELTDPRVVKSVDYLGTLMIDNTKFPWLVGPKGHALRALRLYEERVWGLEGSGTGDKGSE